MKRRWVVVVVAMCLIGLAGSARAGIIDLRGQYSWALVNGMYVQQINPQATGTGYIDPFLKFTDNGPTEQAFNYDAANLALASGNDAYGSANWTHLLETSALATFNVTCSGTGPNACTETPGTAYWKFIIDIDQTGSQPYISLDQLVITSSMSPSRNDSIGAYPDVPTLGQTDIYNMDTSNTGSGNNTLLLNYLWNHGSGSGDYAFYVPVVSAQRYIYLFNSLGNLGTYSGASYANNNGPDEWWVVRGTPVQVPEAASLMLMGSGLIGVAAMVRRRRVAGKK